ncbi:MAG: polymer-forming cytoskeletal protein [Saprospiraceae bacterium]|nr:polymer-forming cytoskeletal protein [Saprospiraceae bacterium]
MFGSNKNKDANKAGSIIPSASTHSLNSLVQGTVVEGKVRATNDIRIDGTIKGDLVCDAKVIIGPSGVIEGTIKCQNAVVEGQFNGILTVAELLNIRETAKVIGDVSYGKLIVQSGAVISGSYKVVGENAHSNGNGAYKNSSPDAKKMVQTESEAKTISGKAGEFAKAN